MKYTVLITLILIVVSCGSKMNTRYVIGDYNSSDSTHKIVGVWKFVTTDPHGNKLNSYQASFGTIEATGPKLFYNKDGTFTQIFKPENSYSGYWRFNPKTSTIEHDLYIDSTDWIGQDLIKRKLAIKKSDGKYYELIEHRVLKLSNDEMWINNRGLINVYKKTHK